MSPGLGCAEESALPGRDLAGRPGEELVHDGEIITSPSEFFSGRAQYPHTQLF